MISFDNPSWLDIAVALVLAVVFIIGLEWYLTRRSRKKS